MTRLLCAVAAIALVVPSAAVAQRQHDRHDDKNATAQRQDRQDQRANKQAARQDRRANNQAARQQNRHQNRTVTERTRTTQRTYRQNNRPTTERVTRTTTRNVYRIGHRPTTYHRIRARTFVYPRGYHYRRWSIGAILPRLFLSSSYYWTDWSALGLLPPPPGYVWVRYGPDILLVNRFTGRVADVIYGAFY